MSDTKILIGTTNPSKLGFFAALLADEPVTLLAPKDIEITGEPEETGKTPLENAILKARFYARFHPNVYTTDSGLFFDSLPPEDPRQPGLHLRSPYGIRLNDEEMLAYYAGLVRGLGGSVTAYYMDSFALIINGQLHTFVSRREELLKTAFILRSEPVRERLPGWPLDSISYDQNGRSFLECDRDPAQQNWGYYPRLKAFTHDVLQQSQDNSQLHQNR